MSDRGQKRRLEKKLRIVEGELARAKERIAELEAFRTEAIAMVHDMRDAFVGRTGAFWEMERKL